jgi:ATP-dependent Clp protease ATP-binding subunit ClpX
MIEGDVVGVPATQGRIHPQERLTNVNTKNILFIGTGAFVGIDGIIKNRIGKTKIGFGNDENNKIETDELLEYLTTEDLMQFGFIPEFIGRFPTISYTKKLSNEDLVKILKEPKNSILKQYKEMLSMDNTELDITEDALLEIANVANKLQTGARALRSITEKVLEDIMFNAPDNRGKRKRVKVIVDKEYVINRTKHMLKFIKAA